MFDKSRRPRVLGAVAICGGLSLAATSFCAGIAGANSARPGPADDPFPPWSPDTGMSTPAPDTGTFLTNAGNVSPPATDAGSMPHGPSDPGTLFSDAGPVMSTPPAPIAVPADPDAVSPEPDIAADPDTVSDT